MKLRHNSFEQRIQKMHFKFQAKYLPTLIKLLSFTSIEDLFSAAFGPLQIGIGRSEARRWQVSQHAINSFLKRSEWGKGLENCMASVEGTDDSGIGAFLLELLGSTLFALTATSLASFVASGISFSSLNKTDKMNCS